MVILAKIKNNFCEDFAVFKRNSFAVCFQELDSNLLEFSLFDRHKINFIKNIVTMCRWKDERA
jgi:hypothetical protein